MLDWDDLRFFLAIHRYGNLSSAAKELRVAQSTVGRRLNSLETTLGVRLLNRTPDGYVLTSAGSDVREKALLLEVQAEAVVHVVGGRDIQLAGLVRVTCAEAVAAYVLAPCFEALHQKHEDILVELIPDARPLSLAQRETDLSVRLTMPSHHETVMRRVGSMAFGLYASRSYLDRHGIPDFAMGAHPFVRVLNDVENASQFRWVEEITSRGKITFQTSSHEAAISAVLEGGGLACLARFRADREKELVLLNPPLAPPTAGLWLCVHKDNRDVARFRTVMDHLTNRIRALQPHLMPHGSMAPDSGTDGS